MNTFLSSQQKALLEEYRSFAKEEISSLVEELDLRTVDFSKFLQKLGQLGYLGLNVPKEHGGKAGTLLEAVLFAQAISEYDPGLSLTISQHIALIEVIKKYGSEEQKSHYLPLLSQGKLLGSVAFSEINAGVDYEAVETSIHDSVVNGEKVWVVNGQFASLFLVLAKDTNGKLSLLLIDKNGNENNLRIGQNLAKMGLNSAYTNNITFSNVKIAESNKLAPNESTNTVALYAMDVAKVILSAGALGMLDSALNIALKHARERKQFGTNIGQFQGIQWKIADFGTELAGAKLQVYRAAWCNSESPDDFALTAAMAKLCATKAARVYTGEAIQILGSQGISQDIPLERFYRDAKVMEICLGTSEFQKIVLTDLLAIAK